MVGNVYVHMEFELWILVQFELWISARFLREKSHRRLCSPSAGNLPPLCNYINRSQPGLTEGFQSLQT